MAGKTVRLTVAQALVRFLCNQMTVIDGERLPIVAGCWAIFGHGNVAGMGEALYQYRDTFPTWCAHNEQARSEQRKFDRGRRSSMREAPEFLTPASYRVRSSQVAENLQE